MCNTSEYNQSLFVPLENGHNICFHVAFQIIIWNKEEGGYSKVSNIKKQKKKKTKDEKVV